MIEGKNENSKTLRANGTAQIGRDFPEMESKKRERSCQCEIEA